MHNSYRISISKYVIASIIIVYRKFRKIGSSHLEATVRHHGEDRSSMFPDKTCHRFPTSGQILLAYFSKNHPHNSLRSRTEASRSLASSLPPNFLSISSLGFYLRKLWRVGRIHAEYRWTTRPRTAVLSAWKSVPPEETTVGLWSKI